MHEFPSTLGREHVQPGNDVFGFSFSWFRFFEFFFGKNLFHFPKYSSSEVGTLTPLLSSFFSLPLLLAFPRVFPTERVVYRIVIFWQLFTSQATHISHNLCPPIWRILDIVTKGLAPKQMPLVPQERSCTHKLQSIDHYNPSVSATAFFYAVCSPISLQSMSDKNPSSNGVAAVFWSTVTPLNWDLPLIETSGPQEVHGIFLIGPGQIFPWRPSLPPIETPPIETFGVRLCTNHASSKERGGHGNQKLLMWFQKLGTFSFCFGGPSRLDFERSNMQQDLGGSCGIKKNHRA